MNNSLIQPYFVMATSQYYKAVVKDLGISHFYAFNHQDLKNGTMIAVPDGCIDILFNCNENNPTAEVCGSVLQAENVETDQNSRYFGVRFYPGEGYAFKDLKVNEIINHQLPLTDLVDAKEMTEKIFATKDFNEQIHIFMKHYTQSINSINAMKNKKSMKDYMLGRIIESQGNIRISQLAKEINYSERYVNKKFIEYFGLRPKIFCKIIRFQNVLNSLNNGKATASKENLLDISVNAGYYDQSHMIKDFSQLSKNTPSKYMELLKDSDYRKRIIEI